MDPVELQLANLERGWTSRLIRAGVLAGADRHRSSVRHRRGTLPVIIGATGHRDLRAEDRQRLEDAIEFVFTDLLDRYPNTPFTLLSPLAEGADRLIARVARALGISLIVPLPMPRELYEADFATQDSRDQFQALLGEADASFALDLPEDVPREAFREPGPARNQLYANVGAYIAHNAAVLISLWDGEPSDKLGGTSQVSRFQLQGLPGRYTRTSGLLDLVERGPVYHIVSPRDANPNPRATPFSIYLLEPDGDSPRPNARAPEEESLGVFDRLMVCIDTFNRDALKLDRGLRGLRATSADDLLPEQTRASLPAHCQTLLERYALADAMAMYFRNRARRTLKVLFGLILVAIITFELFAHVLPDLWELVAANLIAIGLAYLVFVWAGTIVSPFRWLRALLGSERAWRVWAWRQDYKTKYLDYRALAEGMRVQFFWALVERPSAVADQYLHRQRSELDWIRAAVRSWTLLAKVPSGVTTESQNSRLDPFSLVMRHWIQRELEYYQRAASANRGVLRWIGPAVQMLLLLAIIATIGLYAFGSFGHAIDEYERGLLIATIALLTASAALLEGYAEKAALSEQAKQYQRMGQIFTRAKRRLQAAQSIGDRGRAKQVIDELGQEALAENGDWVLLHRARPMEVPIEG